MLHDENRELRLARLKDTIALAASKSSFYRGLFQEMKLTPVDINDFADLQKIPFTTSQQLIDNSQRFWIEPVTTIFCSGGTMGKPKYFAYSREDFQAMSERSSRALASCGVTSDDTVAIADSFGIRSIGHDFLQAIQALGAMAVPIGRMAPQFTMDILQKLNVTFMLTSPSHAIKLIQYATNSGIVPKSILPLKALLLNGETIKSRHRHYLETYWETKIYSVYGAGEFGTIGVECPSLPGVHIVYEDHFVFEIVNPRTLVEVSPGEIGELVVTTLNRSSMPLIRYRLGDLVKKVDNDGSFPELFPYLEIKGRADERIVLQSGNKIYPFQIEAVLSNYPEVVDYQLVAESDGEKDLLTLKVVATHDTVSEITTLLKCDIANLSIDFAPDFGKTCFVEIVIVDPDDLELSPSGKAIKLIDRRS